MSNYTKGPWSIKGSRSLQGPDGEDVAFYGPGIVIAMASATSEESANYKLLVAAPEMAEILLILKERHYNPFEPNNQSDTYKGIKALLKKAGVLE